MKRIILALAALVWLTYSALSQSQLTEHTLALDALVNTASASIEDVAWLAGRWEGQGFSGIIEEVWSPPMGSTPVGTTLKREGDKSIHYLVLGQKDGTHREVTLGYWQKDEPFAEDFMHSVPEISPVSLMVLGSYHMSNPGADMFKLKADDVQSVTRQQEIAAVTNRLALWKPTKIVIESEFGDSTTIAQYKAYLRGEHALRNSEEEQIGFRLAKQLGHETIYPVDVKMGLNQAALGNVIRTDPTKFGPYMETLQTLGTTAMKQMGEWLGTGTIGSMLYRMNSKALNDLSHALCFQVFVPIVQGSDYAGADLVNTWYHRNLRIFGNLHQISDRPDDRILMIYGQVHKPLFERFAEDSPYFRLDDIQEYLRGL